MRASFYIPLFFVPDCCRQTLGIEKGTVGDGQMTAFSTFHNEYATYGAHRARLHRNEWPPGFRANLPSAKDDLPWFRIDLRRTAVITAIATQGYGDISVAEWVTSYSVMYASKNKSIYYFMDEEGEPKVKSRFISQCMDP